MGQIANQMALELFFKIKEKSKKKEREKRYKRTLKIYLIDNMLQKRNLAHF